MTSFFKLQGTGNHFVVFDCFDKNITLTKKQIQFLSSPNFGIGSDGVMMIKPPTDDSYDGEMVIYNADGSLSEMCGNGLRCVAKFIADHHFKETQKKNLKLLTGNGIKTANLFYNKNSTVEMVEIDMGEPIFEGLKIPMILDQNKILNETILIDDEYFIISCVSMGNPHCVIFVDEIDQCEINRIGPLIENSKYFPNRVNVSFVEIVSENELKQRTWERGSQETFACGTGASAVTVISFLLGKINEKVKIHVKGGMLECEYNGEGSVKMKGNAIQVFEGIINIPE
jgi:diaminopimelate epimerase